MVTEIYGVRESASMRKSTPYFVCDQRMKLFKASFVRYCGQRRVFVQQEKGKRNDAQTSDSDNDVIAMRVFITFVLVFAEFYP